MLSNLMYMNFYIFLIFNKSLDIFMNGKLFSNLFDETAQMSSVINLKLSSISSYAIVDFPEPLLPRKM